MLAELPWWLVMGYALLALVMGSFINLLTWRMPQWFEADTEALWQVLVWDRSRCCDCQQPLGIGAMLPVLSWLWQKGKSHCCAQPLPWRYPIIELVSLTLSLMLLWFAPPNAGEDWQIHIPLLLQLCLVWSLLAIAVIDYEHQLIPDRLSLSLLWLGLLVNSSDWQMAVLADAVLGAALGYASLWLIVKTHSAITGRVGMGYGDFKLTAAIGAWLGWQSLLPLFILAGGGALVLMSALMLLGRHDLHRQFSFGPWLSMAACLLLVLNLA